jgi:plastocyanin
VQSIGLPERAVAAGAGLLLIAAVGGAVRHLVDDDPPAAPANATEVVIQDFRFGPGELTVPIGATVTWRNADGFDHTVAGAAADAPPTRSPDLGEGDEYEFTFADAGTYEYVCTIHATMRGTVTVAAS